MTATESQKGGDVSRASISEVLRSRAKRHARPNNRYFKATDGMGSRTGGYLVPPEVSDLHLQRTDNDRLGCDTDLGLVKGDHNNDTGSPEHSRTSDRWTEDYVITIRGDGSPAQTEVVATKTQKR